MVNKRDKVKKILESITQSIGNIDDSSEETTVEVTFKKDDRSEVTIPADNMDELSRIMKLAGIFNDEKGSQVEYDIPTQRCSMCRCEDCGCSKDADCGCTVAHGSSNDISDVMTFSFSEDEDEFDLDDDIEESAMSTTGKENDYGHQNPLLGQQPYKLDSFEFSGHASRPVRYVPAKSGDNPIYDASGDECDEEVKKGLREYINEIEGKSEQIEENYLPDPRLDQLTPIKTGDNQWQIARFEYQKSIDANDWSVPSWEFARFPYSELDHVFKSYNEAMNKLKSLAKEGSISSNEIYDSKGMINFRDSDEPGRYTPIELPKEGSLTPVKSRDQKWVIASYEYVNDDMDWVVHAWEDKSFPYNSLYGEFKSYDEAMNHLLTLVNDGVMRKRYIYDSKGTIDLSQVDEARYRHNYSFRQSVMPFQGLTGRQRIRKSAINTIKKKR